MSDSMIFSNGNRWIRLRPCVFAIWVIFHVQSIHTTTLVESLSIQSRLSTTLPVSTSTTISLESPRTRVPRSRRYRKASQDLSFSPLRSTSSDDFLPSRPTNTTTLSASADDERNNENNDEGNSMISMNNGVLPSYKKLLVFTATTIIIWLSEPLLSLVDTTIVGLTAAAKSAVVQIAALGPATTLFDSLIYSTYFLAIATTNQLAPGLAAAAAAESSLSLQKYVQSSSDEEKIPMKNPWRELRQSTSHLLGLAMIFGFAVTATTFGFGKMIVSKLVGGSANMAAAEAGAIVPLAINYARIRAAVAPFSTVGFVAQSFCLTTLDTVTPAIAVAAASVVNIIGDLALSPRYGIQGAAVATALATVTSCSILLRKVRNTTNQWKEKQELAEDTSTNGLEKKKDVIETAPATDSSVTKVISEPSNDVRMQKDLKDIPFSSIPDKKSLLNLFKLAGPIFFVMMTKVICYNIMTVKATGFGIFPLASHNIMMRVFFFFACFGDSLSQAAQSFYPQVNTKNRGKLIKRLFFIASFVGISNNQASQLILKKFGRFLAKDSNILSLMTEHAPWVGFAVLLHPFIALLEGTVLAKRDLVFLVGMYTLTTFLHLSLVFSPMASTFRGLWRALFGFQLIRIAQFVVRVGLQARTSVPTSEGTISKAERDGVTAPPL